MVRLDSWRIPRFDRATTVPNALPQTRILPTKFKPPVYGVFWAPPQKFAGVRVPVTDMVRAAYNTTAGRIYFPDGEPTGRYDFAATMPEGAMDALQKEIKKTFGLVGHPKTMDTDAFALRVRNPDTPGISLNLIGPVNMSFDIRGHIICKGLPLSSGLTRYLEKFLEKPVIDETGFTGRYDIDFKWKEDSARDPEHKVLKQALLDQLGLELVPTNAPMEMLVMEKVK